MSAMHPVLKSWLPRLVLLALLVLTFAARCYNSADVFHADGRIYFLEGDCYSRMTRVKMVCEGQMVIRHHDFENWPQGTTPHTTAPFDWLIAGLKCVTEAGLRIVDWKGESRMHGQSLDLAGALVSPLLAVATALWLWCWAGWMRLPFRPLMLLFFALSPILVQGMELGRPDHQSLLIFLLAVAVCAELALADLGTPAQLARRWAIVAGVAWGIALWVSLYEPLLFFAGAIGRHVLFNRTALIAHAVRGRWIALGAVILMALFLDGWRLSLPDATLRGHFAAWSRTISELMSLDLLGNRVWHWFGALWLFAPVALWFAGRIDSRARGLLLLVLTMLCLTVWQMRWGYYLALALTVSLPWQLASLRIHWAGWVAGILAMVPITFAWSGMLHPSEEERELRVWRRSVQDEWRRVATFMREPGAFLAPWWASPQIAYWSGQPGVSGTSHQSLAGILDSARFFLTENPAEAATILRERRVRYVLLDDLSHTSTNLSELLMVSNSAKILERKAPPEPFAKVLAESPRQAPPFLRYVTPAERGLVHTMGRLKDGKIEETSVKLFEPQYHQIYLVLPEKL